jgi:hypothetical protein
MKFKTDDTISMIFGMLGSISVFLCFRSNGNKYLAILAILFYAIGILHLVNKDKKKEQER